MYCNYETDRQGPEKYTHFTDLYSEKESGEL